MSASELRDTFHAVLEGGAEKFIIWRLLPQEPSLRSYVEIFLDTPSFFVAYWNTVKITVGILCLQLLVGAPIAWGFAQLSFPGKKVILAFYIILMILPFQIRMLSEYLLLQKLNLLDSLWAVILPSGFSTFPIFIMYNFFKGIPREILEAARVDGANEIQIFFRMGLSIGIIGMTSVVVIGFFEYWSILEQPMLFLNNKTLWPLSLNIPNMRFENIHIIFTSAVLAMIPSVAIFVLGQEYLEKGITGAVIKR